MFLYIFHKTSDNIDEHEHLQLLQFIYIIMFYQTTEFLRRNLDIPVHLPQTLDNEHGSIQNFPIHLARYVLTNCFPYLCHLTSGFAFYLRHKSCSECLHYLQISTCFFTSSCLCDWQNIVCMGLYRVSNSSSSLCFTILLSIPKSFNFWFSILFNGITPVLKVHICSRY